MPARLLIAAVLFLSAGPAFAGHPCQGDFDKYCAGKVVCGKGACHDCLNAHMSELDKACSKALEHWDEKQEQGLSRRR
jgi:hypothetical protein